MTERVIISVIIFLGGYRNHSRRISVSRFGSLTHPPTTPHLLFLPQIRGSFFFFFTNWFREKIFFLYYPIYLFPLPWVLLPRSWMSSNWSKLFRIWLFKIRFFSSYPNLRVSRSYCFCFVALCFGVWAGSLLHCWNVYLWVFLHWCLFNFELGD